MTGGALHSLTKTREVILTSLVLFRAPTKCARMVFPILQYLFVYHYFDMKEVIALEQEADGFGKLF